MHMFFAPPVYFEKSGNVIELGLHCAYLSGGIN